MLYGCGVCCMLLSIWAVIQLVIMALFFFLEVVVFIEEAEPEEYEDFDDFMKKTKQNYRAIAINCLIAAGLYLLCIFLSGLCIKKAKRREKLAAQSRKDDNAICKQEVSKMTDSLFTH